MEGQLGWAPKPLVWAQRMAKHHRIALVPPRRVVHDSQVIVLREADVVFGAWRCVSFSRNWGLGGYAVTDYRPPCFQGCT